MKKSVALFRSYTITISILVLLLCIGIFPWDVSLKLFLLAISGVILIVFGEHFPVEEKLAKKLIHRKIYIPIMLLIFVQSGNADWIS